MNFDQAMSGQPSSGEEDDDVKKELAEPSSPGNEIPKKAGRRKISIEFIEDKSRRHITFSKRKAGIMKKAYELSTLTGTQVLLLVASETGHVYTFATPKLQPLITKPEGKNLIQACLNAPDGPPASPPHQTGRLSQSAYNQEPSMMYPTSDPPYPESASDEKVQERRRGGDTPMGKSSYPPAMDVNQMNSHIGLAYPNSYPPPPSGASSLNHLMTPHLAMGSMYPPSHSTLSSRYMTSPQSSHTSSPGGAGGVNATGAGQYGNASFPSVPGMLPYQNPGGYSSSNTSYMWTHPSSGSSSAASGQQHSENLSSKGSSNDSNHHDLESEDSNIHLLPQKDS